MLVHPDLLAKIIGKIALDHHDYDCDENGFFLVTDGVEIALEELNINIDDLDIHDKIDDAMR